MNVCDSCSKNAECLLEGWEPCKKAIAWRPLPNSYRDPGYVPTGTTNTWHDQRAKDADNGVIRHCNQPTGRKI